MDSQLCIFTLFLWNLGYQESHRTYFFVLFLFPFLCSSCNITLIISTVKRWVLIFLWRICEPVNLWNLHCTLFQFVLHSHSKLIQRPMEDQSTGHSEMFDVNAIIFPWDIVLIRTYRNMEMYKSRLLFQYYCLQVLVPSEYLYNNHRISIASMT